MGFSLDGLFEGIFNAFYKLLYMIEVALCKVVGWMQQLFEVMSGSAQVRYGSKNTYLINLFLFNDTISGAYMGMAMIGIVFTFVFALISVYRKSFDIDDKVKLSYGQILRNMMRSIFYIISLNILVIAVVSFTNMLMNRIDFVFTHSQELRRGSSITFTNEQFAAMSRVFNTIGNYSLNPSYNSRYNLNTCYNAIRTDLIYLERTGMFEFYYETYDKDGNLVDTWQSITQELVLAGDFTVEQPVDIYDEGIANALSHCMNVLKTNSSFTALQTFSVPEYKGKSRIGIDNILFLIGTMGNGDTAGARNNAYNSNPSMIDNLRYPYYTGTKNIYDFDQVNKDFDISVSKTNYLVVYLAAIPLMLNLIIIVMNCIVRMFNMMFLYLIAPPLFGIAPLDDGGKIRQWMTAFMIQSFSVFATVISMRVFLIFVPIAMDPQLHLSNSDIINYIGKLVIVYAGTEAIKKANGLLTGILADMAGHQSVMAGDMGSEVNNSMAGRALQGLQRAPAALAGFAAAKGIGAGVGLAKFVGKDVVAKGIVKNGLKYGAKGTWTAGKYIGGAVGRQTAKGAKSAWNGFRAWRNKSNGPVGGSGAEVTPLAGNVTGIGGQRNPAPNVQQPAPNIQQPAPNRTPVGANGVPIPPPPPPAPGLGGNRPNQPIGGNRPAPHQQNPNIAAPAQGNVQGGIANNLVQSFGDEQPDLMSSVTNDVMNLAGLNPDNGMELPANQQNMGGNGILGGLANVAQAAGNLVGTAVGVGVNTAATGVGMAANMLGANVPLNQQQIIPNQPSGQNPPGSNGMMGAGGQMLNGATGAVSGIGSVGRGIGGLAGGTGNAANAMMNIGTGLANTVGGVANMAGGAMNLASGVMNQAGAALGGNHQQNMQLPPNQQQMPGMGNMQQMSGMGNMQQMANLGNVQQMPGMGGMQPGQGMGSGMMNIANGAMNMVGGAVNLAGNVVNTGAGLVGGAVGAMTGNPQNMQQNFQPFQNGMQPSQDGLQELQPQQDDVQGMQLPQNESQMFGGNMQGMGGGMANLANGAMNMVGGAMNLTGNVINAGAGVAGGVAGALGGQQGMQQPGGGQQNMRFPQNAPQMLNGNPQSPANTTSGLAGIGSGMANIGNGVANTAGSALNLAGSVVNTSASAVGSMTGTRTAPPTGSPTTPPPSPGNRSFFNMGSQAPKSTAQPSLSSPPSGTSPSVPGMSGSGSKNQADEQPGKFARAMDWTGDKLDQGYDWAMDKTFDTAEDMIMGAVKYVTGVDGRWGQRIPPPMPAKKETEEHKSDVEQKAEFVQQNMAQQSSTPPPSPSVPGFSGSQPTNPAPKPPPQPNGSQRNLFNSLNDDGNTNHKS